MERGSADILRVLVTDGEDPRSEELREAVTDLGHEVITRHASLADVGAITVAERPDVALVIVGETGEHALGMIDRIVHEAACPVIAVLDVEDREFVQEAARRGIFAYVTSEEAKELQSAIDIVLRRFAEYHNLEGAFGRRAVTERAKGILMERHGIDEQAAFEMLRRHARETQAKLVDVAEIVIQGHRLLPADPGRSADESAPGDRRP
ncbi:MAG TPA: ANTAR domain-containing protein [Actinomycetota bacterium]|nr:ANTAR domain-containing protein [Actinomycetota bacterium]